MSDADFRSKARPIGWQDIVNPNLTRRGLIGGLVASPVALYAGIGRASENAWYDLEFEISPDLSSVAVLEVKVIPQTPMQDCGEGERPEIRSVECRWDIPAAAFGPDAFFDMDEPGPNQICQASPPPQRTIYVRNVQYGLRFTKEDKEPIAPAVGSKNKPGFVAFIFNRPGTRWQIAYLTDLWLLTAGGSDGIDSSRPAEFRAFLGKPAQALIDPADLGAKSPKEPFEIVAAGRVDKTLKVIFDQLIGAAQPLSGNFMVAFDRHLVWKVTGGKAVSMVAHESKVAFSEFSFAWRRTTPEKPAGGQSKTSGASTRQQTPDPTSGAEGVVYFSGEVAAGKLRLTNAAGMIEIGAGSAYHVRLRPYDACAMRLDAIVGAAPTMPKDLQVVSSVSAGAGVLAVADGARILADGIAGTGMVLAQTSTPKSALPRALRSTLWGDAAGAGPLFHKPVATNSKLSRGDIVTPVGRLRIDKPVLATQASGDKDKDGGGAGTKKDAPAAVPAAVPPAAATTASPGIVVVMEAAACAPTGDKPDSEAKTEKELARFFQAANGDRGGAPNATLFVLHDRPSGSSAPGAVRRVHFDTTVLAATTGLPDTSYSRLAFRNSDLRLVYEDGRSIDELSAGEYPRPIASSFVWIGPLFGSDARRAAFDLSGATLVCGRDYDLMKLRLRFRDLLLIYQPDPKIVPARDDARVMVGDDGAVHDGRPILVAEFDPQHVMEEAIFRPDAPPLPDIDLDQPETTYGLKTREQIVEKLDKTDDVKERINIRIAVRDAKKKQESAKAPLILPFSKMADAFEPLAGNLPSDQRIYIGPFKLDADGMAIARGLMASIGPAAVTAEVDAMLGRVAAQALDLAARLKLLVVNNPADSVDLRFANAKHNETVFEALEPLYGVFRGFWRDKIATYVAQTIHNLPAETIEQSLGFPMPAKIDPVANGFLVEYLTPSNRFAGYGDDAAITKITESIRDQFVAFALGIDKPDKLMGARLSGRSRLAFRIDCEPASGIDAREAGVENSSGNGPLHPGAGNSRFAPIPFTFEALTDWSRYEPAVTKRARKLYQSLPSGILPRPGDRAANPSDQAMMRFQGFSEAPTTGEARMAEVRASLKSERLANTENGDDQPFAGEPLDLETAIEIPSRLILSTAQDAIWRTNRRMPPEVYKSANGEPIAVPPMTAPIVLEEGGGLAGATTTSQQPRDLWSVRLETSAETPSLRMVASPDLRTTALGGYRTGDKFRKPGQGSPPRGPYAPWFIGPEQMESGTLTAARVAAEIGEENYACPVAPAPPHKFRLIRWLCERAGLYSPLPTQDYTVFRTSLDAYDRHQLVLLSSVYGLPVIGKREPAAGVKPGDVESGGGLISDSGQIEPGEAFSLLDANDDQALHKPVPINVKALSLTALGGSFLHDTAFKPSAGLDDISGQKIFEGFSIDTLQQDIVLGRDIRTEVVYKGYLLPLGHKASFVKLTERIFLRTKTRGIKAMLRQRMFLRMAEPDKLYAALGQPHGGRIWCGKHVSLLADKTPDILDPTFSRLGNELSAANPESLHGRIFIGQGPGLAFWPRTDITDAGLYRFEITIDGAPTALPMIFLDNIAATSPESLKAAADYYNGKLAESLPDPEKSSQLAKLLARRTLMVNGHKIDFAASSNAGEAQFETEAIRVRVHGRLRSPTSASWTGELEEQNNFETTSVLEGANQPPFYPAMETATIRLGSVERMSGGQPKPVDVQYDGHYVLFGFKDDPVPQGFSKPEDEKENPKQIFLNIRGKALDLAMGNNGDRSGGIARPETHYVGIGLKGPMGGDEFTWWAANPNVIANPNGVPDTIKGGPPDVASLDAVKLASLAPYFNEKVARPKLEDPKPNADGVTPVKPDDPDIIGKLGDAAAILKQVQSYFSLDAKLLGTIKLKDLMVLLGLDVDSIPILKEVQEFGTAAGREIEQQVGSVGNDVRSRVLVPLRNVIVLLRNEWTKLDNDLQDKQIDLPALKDQKTEPLSLKDIYPEIDGGLGKVEAALNDALATEHTVSLLPKLAAIYTAARGLIRGLSILAANPIGRLEEAVVGNLRERISGLTKVLDDLVAIVGQLQAFKDALPEQVADTTADTITGWIFQNIVPVGQSESNAQIIVAEYLPIGVLPPDLDKIVKVLMVDTSNTADTFRKAVTNISTDLRNQLEQATRTNLRNLIKEAIAAILKGAGLKDAFRDSAKTYVVQVRQLAKTHVDAAIVELNKAGDDAKASADAALDQIIDEAVVALTGVANDVVARLDLLIADLVAKLDPDEIQVILAGLERIKIAIDSGKKVAQTVRDGDPKLILEAGGAFAVEVLGVNVTSVVDELKSKVQTPLFDALKEAKKALLSTPLIGTSAEQQAILRQEIAALRATSVPLKGPPPILDDTGKVIASNALLLGIGQALKALLDFVNSTDLDAIKSEITAKENEINTAAGSNEQLKAAKLTAFVDELKELLQGKGSDPKDGLIIDLRKLYGDIVDVVVATQQLDAAFAAIDPASPDQKKVYETIATTARTLRALGSAIGDRLKTIFEETTTFIAKNEAIIGTAGVLAGTFATLEKLGIVTQIPLIKGRVQKLETDVVSVLSTVVDFGLTLIGTSIAGIGDGVAEVKNGVAAIASTAAGFGLPLTPESDALQTALGTIKQRLDTNAGLKLQGSPTTLNGLLSAKVSDKASDSRTVKALFTSSGKTEYRKLADEIRDAEAASLKAWRGLQQRIEGAPGLIKNNIEDWVAKIFTPIGEAYNALVTHRTDLLAKASQLPILAPVVRKALLVRPIQGLSEKESDDLLSCNVDDLSKPTDVLLGCDRLAQELQVVVAAKNIATLGDADRKPLRRRIAVLFRGWSEGLAAPLLIIAQARDIAKDLLRGDVFAAIDLGAFRDQIEDAIAALIPTKVNFAYDFNSIIDKKSDSQAILQPKLGAEFGIMLRASIDLLKQTSDFSASAHIGPFDIFLIGGVIDALRLKFGGAAFSVRSNTAARFDVIYDDFVIGKDLEFAQKLQSFLAPKDGSGVFIQPMTRGAGIEAGYGINLGTIGVGATSFFNVTLNVSAELPFGNEESLFKVSLGRRLSPFTMGVFPFVGSGYFSIFAAADGVRGFEASFEYGGGAAIGFGPLAAQCRIQVGVFVRILKADGKKTTEIYGTFFAGGSASIWIFHFATSLYVRLGTAEGGAMYGEAIYSFSFSLGIADYDYSITANKKEKALGSGQASLEPSGQGTRFAGAPGGIDMMTTGSTSRAGSIIIAAADQELEWTRYARYFDTTLIMGLAP